MLHIFSKLRLLGVILVFSLSLGSCSQIEAVGTDDELMLSPLAGTTTKAPIDGTVFPEERKIQLAAWEYADPIVYRKRWFPAVTFSRSDADNLWHATPPKYWPVNGGLRFAGLSADGLSGTVTFPWSAEDAAAQAEPVIRYEMPDNSTIQDDVLYSGLSVYSQSSSGVTSLVFNHAQGQVAFSAAGNMSYDAATNYGIEITGIVLKEMKYSGTMTVSEAGDISWGGLGSEKTLAVPGIGSVHVLNSAEAVQVGSGVLLPVQDFSGFTMRYVQHNGKDSDGTDLNREFVHEWIPSEPVSLAAGQILKIDLYFTLNEIIVSPSVVEWDTIYEEVTIPHDYERDYLTLDIVSGGNVVWSRASAAATGRTIEYSVNGGDWTSITATTAGVQIPVSTGDKVRLRGTETTNYDSGVRGSLGGTAGTKFNVCGNVMSLEYGDGFAGKKTFQGTDSFRGLFEGISASNTAVVDASHMVLPASALTSFCYEGMFNKCTSLTQAPVLLATTLAASCYENMFYGCSSLESFWRLPATTLANRCYASMFRECGKLTVSPELPATHLAEQCYVSMFRNCSGLKEAPRLAATVMVKGCYQNMFVSCTSLEVAPELPATTMVASCYDCMFQNCSKLKRTPELPATTLAERCYAFMFSGCSSLATAPELPATTLVAHCYRGVFNGCSGVNVAPDLPAAVLVNGCYYQMFQSCRNLNYIKCLATNISAADCLTNWTRYAPATGTFVRARGMVWPRSANGIPAGWTVVDAE